MLPPSISGNKYTLIVYDYDSNTIHIELFATRKTSSQIDAYEKISLVLTSHSLAQTLLTMDNEVSKVLVDFLDNGDIPVQRVSPHLHRHNVSEQTIRELWASHAIYRWYIDPILRYYRCFCIWATVTNSECIAHTIVWFP